MRKIEFKMGKEWWIQFLTSVLGTAIGVGLTFAVGNIVDSRNKELAQRQTAMMAVYDIDEIVGQLKEATNQENIMSQTAIYLSNHQEALESVSSDTVRIAALCLLEDKTFTPRWTDDTKEKAFTSSMEAWNNLSNTKFYDNVQECYRIREELLTVVNNDICFRKPLSYDFINQRISDAPDIDLEYDGTLTSNAIAKLLKESFSKPEVKRYLKMSFLRTRIYNQYMEKLVQLNQQNKFLMNISDKEMDEYVLKNVEQARHATAKLIKGEWQLEQHEQLQSYEFRADNTMEMRLQIVSDVSLLLDDEGNDVQVRIPLEYSLNGKWMLEADSLHFDYNPETAELLSMDLDLSNVPDAAMQERRDSLDSFKQRFGDYMIEQIKASPMTDAYKVSFDVSGNLMFLENEFKNPLGQAETTRQQLVRQK